MSNIHAEAQLCRKFTQFAKLLNIYLNHFPKAERYALANRIRNSAYEVYDLITEAQKRYIKKTTLTNLDIAHERLRMQIYLAYELGHFRFKDGRKGDDAAALERHRYTTLGEMVDELGRMIEHKIKDERLLNVMMMYADHEEPVGIPIGNLLSQLYALIYLNPVDHYVKRGLGIAYYARYVDDMLIMGVSREQAVFLRDRIGEFLAEHLHLEYSKTSIAKVRRGVNFVGYRTWRRFRFTRKHSLYKFRRAVKKGDAAAVVSILGHAKNTQSLPYLVRTIMEAEHDQNLPLSNRVRRAHHLPPPGHRRGPRSGAVHH